MRASLCLLLFAATSAQGVENLLYEDFQDGTADGWQSFGEESLRIIEYEGNGSLRLRSGSAATRAIALNNASRIRAGASYAATGLGDNDACIAEITLDDGDTWTTVQRVQSGQDDGFSLHSGAVSLDISETTSRAWLRARVAGDKGTCWLDDVFVNGNGTRPISLGPRILGREFFFGNGGLDKPVDMGEFTRPDSATGPRHRFSGSLRLVPSDSGSTVVFDAWDRVGDVGDAIRGLPEFDFEFVQHGDNIVPLQRGVQRTQHPYWEVILQPGKAWHEDSDGDWSRASISLSLQERSANCTHNGVLTWLYNDTNVSRAAYQVSSETCGYFKIDLWGVSLAEYTRADLSARSAGQLERFDRHRARRLPIEPLSGLAASYPGVEPMSFGVEDGINPADMTVYGMVVDGVNYRSDCSTRHGPHPYCASLPLPSYSTAKSIFAGVATMRMEKISPGSSRAVIGTLIEECDRREWRDVSIGNALDMATGNYRNAVGNADEDSIPHRRFVFQDTHARKIEFACSYFRRKAEPGTRFVYHTSDTYLVGTALQNLLREQRGDDADLYKDLVVDQIWRPLGLSPLLDEIKRTYDTEAQPFMGYGLTYEVDDIVRIAEWLRRDSELLDTDMLNASLQRDSADRGIRTGLPDLNYNNGFWAYNSGPSLACRSATWVPFMSGVSGITIALFPNGVTYYYFSDSYVFRWQSARQAAHTIRSLCE